LNGRALPGESPMKRRFPALFHRDFRLLWSGQAVSLTGSMMQQAAIFWHVALLAEPGHKGLALGLVGAVRFIPIVAFAVLGGVVADALDRKKVMVATQTAMAGMATGLALLTFFGFATTGLLYLLAGLTGAAGAFDSPARQSLIPNLVPRADLPNAISLNTMASQVASIAGPSLAGLTIAWLGIGWVYVINAVSFLFVIAALLRMRSAGRAATESRVKIGIRAAREGLAFVFRTPLIRSTMVVDFVATLFGSAMALLPIYAQDILHVGPTGYGWLYAAPSVGAVFASLAMIPLVERMRRRGTVMLAAITTYGVFTVLFGLSSAFWLTFLCLAGTGAADTVSMVLRNIIRQLETPDNLRGRMTGVNMIFFMGGPQLGELEAGLVAQWLGAPFSVVSGGIGCLVAVAAVAFMEPDLRRYRNVS
jgi:MFS family permease